MFHGLPILSHPPKQAHRRGPLRIASAERRVKPPARLLRRATALRVAAPLGCGSGVWYGVTSRNGNNRTLSDSRRLGKRRVGVNPSLASGKAR